MKKRLETAIEAVMVAKKKKNMIKYEHKECVAWMA